MTLYPAGARRIWFDGLLSTPMYVALHAAHARADTELSGGGYARVVINSDSWIIDPVRGTATTTVEIAFPIGTAEWPEPTHVAFWSAPAAGDLLFGGAIAIPPGELAAGTPVRFGAGLLVLSGNGNLTDAV